MGGTGGSGPKNEPGRHRRSSRPSYETRPCIAGTDGSSWSKALSSDCGACPIVPLRWEEMARVLDSMDTGVNAASAWISWSGGHRGSRELPASFRVQLPRHTCAHVLALCIYTVHVESRFIYRNVKIYFPFLKDHGKFK